MRKTLATVLSLAIALNSLSPLVHSTIAQAQPTATTQESGTEAEVPLNFDFAEPVGASDSHISITGSGFVPAVVTVTLGIPVVWTNQTEGTVHLASGEPYQVYLPLVVRNDAGDGIANDSHARTTVSANRQDAWGDVDIAPGESYTHTFAIPGSHPYYLSDHPNFTGRVVVQSVPFDFDLGVSPATQSVAQGQSVTYTVQVTTTVDSSQAVTLTVGGLPADSLWDLNPATVVPTDTAVLSVTTALTTSVGDYTLVITGTGGGQLHTTTATLSVTPHPDFALSVVPSAQVVTQGQAVTYTVSLTSEHGFAEPVTLSISDVPTDTVASWSVNPITPTGNAVLTITTTASTPLGSYPITVSGVGGGWSHDAQVTLTVEAVPAPDFELGIWPATQAITRGHSVTYTVAITALHGFTQSVTLAIGGVPTGTTVAWAANPVTPTASTTIVLTTSATGPSGAFTPIITGTADSLVHTAQLGLSILGPTVEVCGDITTDTTWRTGTLYLVTCDVTVQSGVTLMVQPSVVVKFNGNSLYIYGTLDVKGTASDVVTFTSGEPAPAPGDWTSLDFYAGSIGRFDYAVVEYGASRNIYSYADASVSVTNSMIRNAQDIGIEAEGPITITDTTITGNNRGVILSDAASAFNGNTISGNTDSAVDLFGAAANTTLGGNTISDSPIVVNFGLITTTVTWPNFGVPYVIERHLEIAADGTLTIEAGAMLKFPDIEPWGNDGVSVYGMLDVKGTAGDVVTFTSGEPVPAPGDWTSLDFYAGSIGRFDYAVVEYGASRNIYSYADASVSVTNSMIRNAQDIGIEAEGPITITNTTITGNDRGVILSDAASAFNGNTISGNTDSAVDLFGAAANTTLGGNTISDSPIVVNFGLITTTVTWPNFGVPYVIERHLEIAADGTLTIEAGAMLKFPDIEPWGNDGVSVYGMLDVKGTAGDVVTFTSGEPAPAPGDWTSLDFYAGSIGRFDYAVVEYGASRNIYSYADASVSVTNSMIRNAQDIGIEAEGPITITDTTITGNDRGVILSGAAANTTLRHNNIYNNGAYGLYNSSTIYAVDARYNWWGDASGPAPFGSGDAINGRTVCDPTCHTVYDIILVHPWLGSPAAHSYNSAPSSRWSNWEADPVNVVFGNYVHQHTDLAIPGRGLDFAFQRTYNSNILENGPLGLGWTHSYNITVTETATDTVVVRRADGRLDQYVWNGSEYAPPPGSHDELAKVGSTFILTQTDQIILNFDTQGRLASMTDPNGNTLALTYSGSDLTTITLSDGRAVTLAYSGGRLTGLADPAGRTVGFGYTGDYLTVITDTRGFATTYAYEGQGRLESITDANGHTFVHNTYNADGRVVEQRDAYNNLTTFSYYTDTRQTVVTDPLGRVITHTYDTAYRIIGEQDPLGNEISYQWDADNNRIAVTDKRGNTTMYAYDDRGNTTVITDALGYTHIFTYDIQNNLTSETDPLGYTTVYTYDVSGNLVVQANPLGDITTWGYDTHGQVISQTDALSHTTLYGYDTYGHLTIITNALGYTTTFTYDLVGRKLSETDAEGHPTSYGYDAANHTTVITDALGNPTYYGYDAVGHLGVATDTNGRVTTYEYDAAGRLITTTAPMNLVTSYTYDAVGNKIRTVKPSGVVITYTYDSLNHLDQTIYSDRVVDYDYDANGNRISLSDAHGTITYTYDALSRPTAVGNPDGQVVSYGYDAVGNRTHLIYPDGRTITYTYDATSRPVNVIDWANRVFTITYDAVGTPVSLVYPNGVTTTYEYNDVNLVTAITHTSGVSGTFAAFHYTHDNVGNRLSEVSTEGTVTYIYDSLNQLTGVQYPDGEVVSYAYDPFGNRTAMTSTVNGVITYTYDAVDRLLTAGVDTFGWDANGNLITRTYGPQVVTYTFDSADHLTQVVSGTTVVTFAYDGDGVRVGKGVNGSLTSYVQDVASPLPLALVESSGGQDTLYIYGIGLLAAVEPGDIPTYYHHDALGSVRGLSNPAGQAIASYSYDAFGALRTATGDTTEFGFTGEQADEEIGLLYLRSRYYDPSLGRFASRDWFPGFIHNPASQNRYVYCQNNPVNFTDPSGEFMTAGAFVTMYAGNIAVSIAKAEMRVLAVDIVHTYQYYRHTGQLAFQSSGKQAYLDAAKEGLKSGTLYGWIPGPLGEGIRLIRDIYKWGRLYFSLAEPALAPSHSGFGELLRWQDTAPPSQPPAGGK